MFPEVTVMGFPADNFARATFPKTKSPAELVTDFEALVLPVTPLLLADVPPEAMFSTPKYEIELPTIVVALFAVTVIVAAPDAGLGKYQTSLRTNTVPVEPVPQKPALLSSMAARQVRFVLPSLIPLIKVLPLGLELSTLSETPTSRILPSPGPIVWVHAKVTLVPEELGAQLEPELPVVEVAQSALPSKLIAACDGAGENASANTETMNLKNGIL